MNNTEERIMDRLSRWMQENGVNDNQMTVNCGLSVGLLNKARKGESDIGKAAVRKILAAYPDIDRVWLLTGETAEDMAVQNLGTEDMSAVPAILARAKKVIAMEGGRDGNAATVSTWPEAIEWARCVTYQWPKYSLTWILTGYGSMYKDAEWRAGVIRERCGKTIADALKNMAAAELAKRLGIDEDILKEIVDGSSDPGAETLSALCRELGADPAYLLALEADF